MLQEKWKWLTRDNIVWCLWSGKPDYYEEYSQWGSDFEVVVLDDCRARLFNLPNATELSFERCIWKRIDDEWIKEVV